jgi:hypothetical protein
MSAIRHPSLPTNRELPIKELEKRHPGISVGLAASYCEAAAICLSRHHESPANINIKHNSELIATASWDLLDDTTLRAWANETDATEAGAYGIALASVEISDGLVAYARAETRTGVDYYLGPADNSLPDLENSHRLEVSGISTDNESKMSARLQRKIAQAKAGNSNLPAIAAIVGFLSKTVLMGDLESQ